jgi:hypothetical protein
MELRKEKRMSTGIARGNLWNVGRASGSSVSSWDQSSVISATLDAAIANYPDQQSGYVILRSSERT